MYTFEYFNPKFDFWGSSKIHTIEISEEDHSIQFEENETSLRTPLQLWGIFSFFHTRTPTPEEINTSEVLFLTPDSLNWKPYSEHFASNEESMLDWEGHIQDKRYRKKHIIAKDFSAMIDSVMVSAFNATATSDDDVAPYSNRELEYLSKSLNSRAEVSKFSAPIEYK